MATNERLTDLPVEVVSPGSGDARLTALPVEIVGPGSGDARLSGLTVEIIAPNPQVSLLRVTEAGAQVAQAADTSQVTQVGAASAQQKGEIFVTEIGLIVIYNPETPPEPPTPEPDVCVLELPSVERLGDNDVFLSAIGAQPIEPESVVRMGANDPALSAIGAQPTEPASMNTIATTPSIDAFKVGLIGSDE